MDNLRLALFFALAVILLLIWQAWQHDYGSAPKPATTTSAQQQTPAARGETPSPPLPPGSASVTTAAPAPTAPRRAAGQSIHVVTDVLDAEINTSGGNLQKLSLRAYPAAVNEPHRLYPLLNDAPPYLFLAQTGLLSPSGAAPDHHAIYTAQKPDYRLAPGAQDLQVPLRWTAPNGLQITKVYTFHRGSYVVNVDYRIRNASGQAWSGREYCQLLHTDETNGHVSHFVPIYNGAALYSQQDKYQKITYEDMRKKSLRRTLTGGWAAMVEHYFLGACIPDQKAQNYYYTNVLSGGRYVIGLVTPPVSVAPGGTADVGGRLYFGPKLQNHLAQVAPGLELTVDYGRLTFLAQPIFWLLKHIYDLVGNWGWAIILLTVLIKLAFYKLSETSYRSMARMRNLQPRLQALKEMHGDDRQRLNQAMMELYKKEKINPLGGCLPILVQIPVFIALYWVLLESVELRQAPFILWLHDLSAPDPYYVLPLLMGVTMLLQQRLNPAPIDPIQQKVMMVLPVVFTVFFAFFPSGLVLYWVVNNTLSIAQQWVITRRLEHSVKTKPAKK